MSTVLGTRVFSRGATRRNAMQWWCARVVSRKTDVGVPCLTSVALLANHTSTASKGDTASKATSISSDHREVQLSFVQSLVQRQFGHHAKSSTVVVLSNRGAEAWRTPEARARRAERAASPRWS